MHWQQHVSSLMLYVSTWPDLRGSRASQQALIPQQLLAAWTSQLELIQYILSNTKLVGSIIRLNLFLLCLVALVSLQVFSSIFILSAWNEMESIMQPSPLNWERGRFFLCRMPLLSPLADCDWVVAKSLGQKHTQEYVSEMLRLAIYRDSFNNTKH